MRRFFDLPLDAPARLTDGTRRAASIDATWRRFSPRARAAGITRIADLTGLDTLGVPVFAAIRPMGRSLSTQQGKGVTAAAARVSALMESLETFSAEHLARPVRRGSHRALRRRLPLVDVRRLPRPRRRLDLDAAWAWVEGFDLTAGQPIWVPREAVTLDCVFRAPPTFDVSSNGLASGNHLVEAIVHGLCEVIERDAEAAWRAGGGDRRLVLDSIRDAATRGLIDRIVAAGARLWLWDLTSDVGVPVIACAILEDPDGPPWRPLGFYQGFGAHLDPEIAVARALTEAAQTRLTYIAGARDDFFPADYARATDRALLQELWATLTTPCETPALLDDLPRAPAQRLGADLDLLLDRLAAAGTPQVIAVDATHPDLGVPVARVLVPGRATDLAHLG